jgi:hypothetical protein
VWRVVEYVVTMASMIKSTTVRRRLVLALALVCLWISTVGTAHHDDSDMATVRGFIVHHSTLGQASAPSGPDYCVACAWEQALASGHTPYVAVQVSPQFEVDQSTPTAGSPLHVRTILNASPRAPPTLNV